MDNIDYTVKLNAVGNSRELCLQEFNSDGEQVKDNLFPWTGGLQFKVTNIKYQYQIKNAEDPNFLKSNEEIHERGRGELYEVSQSVESITAELVLTESEPSLSMVGTDRKTREIYLTIEKGKKYSCRTDGLLSFSDIVSGHHDDNIRFFLQLIPEKFNELSQVINSVGLDDASFYVSGVSGFYSSDHFFSHRVDCIKILTHQIHRRIEVLENTEIEPPVLGSVENFNFMLKNNQKFMSENTRAAANEISSDFLKWVTKCTERYFKNKYKVVSEELKRVSHYREYAFINTLYKEAARYAEDKNFEPDDLENLEEKISDFFYDLDCAFPRDSRDEVEQAEGLSAEVASRIKNSWDFQVQVDKILKDGKPVHIVRVHLAEAVANYLALPIRCDAIDRLLIDILIGVEYMDFADQMVHLPAKFPRLHSKHPLINFITVQWRLFIIIAAIPIGILVGSVLLFEINSGLPFFVGAGFASLWFLAFLIGLILLPSTWAEHNRTTKKISKMLVDMETIHKEIRDGGLLSARHIRERLEHTATKDIIWPSEVFALLDDIVGRGKALEIDHTRFRY